MAGVDFLERTRSALAGRSPEPVEVALLVHPTDSRKKKLFGKDLASRLRTNNYLVLTSSSVRLYALGGTSGMGVKDELGAWPRALMHASVTAAERSAWFASTGSSLQYDVHRLRLRGPDLDLEVDVRADAGLFTDGYEFLDQTDADPEVQEAIDGLRQEIQDTVDDINTFVGALTRA